MLIAIELKQRRSSNFIKRFFNRSRSESKKTPEPEICDYIEGDDFPVAEPPTQMPPEVPPPTQMPPEVPLSTRMPQEVPPPTQMPPEVPPPTQMPQEVPLSTRMPREEDSNVYPPSQLLMYSMLNTNATGTTKMVSSNAVVERTPGVREDHSGRSEIDTTSELYTNGPKTDPNVDVGMPCVPDRVPVVQHSNSRPALIDTTSDYAQVPNTDPNTDVGTYCA